MSGIMVCKGPVETQRSSPLGQYYALVIVFLYHYVVTYLLPIRVFRVTRVLKVVGNAITTDEPVNHESVHLQSSPNESLWQRMLNEHIVTF